MLQDAVKEVAHAIRLHSDPLSPDTPGFVFVGPGSRFASPFINGQKSLDRVEATAMYRDWLVRGPLSDFWDDQDWPQWIHVIRQLPYLRGCALGDVVPLDEPSHADVLVELANGPLFPIFGVHWVLPG
jgi:hypothetical protein